MESKLLPPDLLSCEDESSPKNNISGQISSFNSDSMDRPSNCFTQLTCNGVPTSRKQTEAEENFSEQMRVSAFEPFGFAGGQKQISEFTLCEDESKNAVS